MGCPVTRCPGVFERVERDFEPRGGPLGEVPPNAHYPKKITEKIVQVDETWIKRRIVSRTYRSGFRTFWNSGDDILGNLNMWLNHVNNLLISMKQSLLSASWTLHTFNVFLYRLSSDNQPQRPLSSRFTVFILPTFSETVVPSVFSLRIFFSSLSNVPQPCFLFVKVIFRLEVLFYDESYDSNA